MPADRQAFRDDSATARTCLASERGIDRLRSLPGARRLESEDGKKRCPTGIRDALSKGVILNHVTDPQVFMVYRVVLPNQRERRLVVKILPLVADVLMRSGEERDGLASPMAPLLAPRHSALAASQIGVRLAIVTRRGDRLPVGQRGEGLQPQINSRLLAGARNWLYGHVRAGESHMPTVSLMRDRDGLGHALNRARPMHADAPNLGEDEEAVVKPRTIAVLLEGEGVDAVAALEPWETRLLAPLDATKERLVGLIKPGKHILQDVAMDGLVLRHLGANGLEFGFLLVARDRDAAPLPGGDALLEGGVIEIAATP